MEFLDDSYDYDFVGIEDGAYVYSFVSVGATNIIKRVSLNPLYEGDIYNLGFGNLEIVGDEQVFNDKSLDNNKDFHKVLCTVFNCLVHFLKLNNSAQVVFFGNTKHKHLLYLRKITANFENLSKIFTVRGGVLRNHIPLIERYDASNRIIHEKGIDDSILDELDVEKVERFDVLNSRNYHFVLIGFE